MNAPHLATLSFALLLSACGGPGFEGRGDEPAELAGAAGDVDPGTGGSSGSATGGAAGGPQGGDDAGGSSGAGSGGTAAAGSGSAGAAGSGATGAGGEPSGGMGGGPSVPSCTPEEAITAAGALPESFTWDGFDSVFEAEDQSYCAYSAGGLCTTRNIGLTFFAQEPSVRLYVFISCTASFYAGPCGAETACGASVDPAVQPSRMFTIEPAGDGYRLLFQSDGLSPGLVNRDSCRTELPTGGYATPIDDARPDLQHALFAPAARTYPCP